MKTPSIFKIENINSTTSIKLVNRLFHLLIFLLVISGSGMKSYSQDSTTSDGLFLSARAAAFQVHDFQKAKNLCRKALQISPSYQEIRIFLGRLYSWNKQYDSASITFSQVLHEEPGNEEATLAFSDMKYQNDQYMDALKLVNEALTLHDHSIALLLGKAKLLNALERYNETYDVLDDILKRDKNNQEARALANQIKYKAAIQKIGVNYDYVYFDKQFNDPWHLVSLDYTRKTRIGSVTARINYANRFANSGWQYEIEAYPHLSKALYTYFELGYSNNVGVFPHWRSGFSLFANLPRSFEAEAGWRYLNFSAPTNIYTVYLGKYYKKYLFGIHSYLTPDQSTVSQSYNAFARYYFSGADDYFGLSLGSGVSPDDRSINQQLSEKNQLKTYKIAAEAHFTIKSLSILTLNASLINQEYLPYTKGNQVQIGVGYQRCF
jgi:YaiO family outer membrane protein